MSFYMCLPHIWVCFSFSFPRPYIILCNCINLGRYDSVSGVDTEMLLEAKSFLQAERLSYSCSVFGADRICITFWINLIYFTCFKNMGTLYYVTTLKQIFNFNKAFLKSLEILGKLYLTI